MILSPPSWKKLSSCSMVSSTISSNSLHKVRSFFSTKSGATLVEASVARTPKVATISAAVWILFSALLAMLIARRERMDAALVEPVSSILGRPR